MGLFDDIFKDMFSDEAMFYDYIYLMSLEAEKKKQQELERKQRAALYDYTPPILPMVEEPAPPALPAKPKAVTPPVTASPKPKEEPHEEEEEDPWWENLSYEIMELADKYFVDPELYDDADSFFDELELSSGKDLWEERLWYTGSSLTSWNAGSVRLFAARTDSRRGRSPGSWDWITRL